MPQFADRKKVKSLYGSDKDDWWIMDFTLQELRSIKIKQVLVSGRTDVLFIISSSSRFLIFNSHSQP
jgi:hypothetical protein